MNTVSKLWQIFYWAWVVSEVLVLLITRTRRSSGEVRDRGSLLILWPVIFSSIWLGFWVGATRPHTMFRGAHWPPAVSLALLISGLAIRWTAIAMLGRSFSANVAIHASQKLYTGGLFRLVRHPSYTGMLLIFLAIGIATRNWLSLAILMVPPTAALLYRIHVEESAMGMAFGEEYEAYRRKTKRLIPAVY